MNMVIVQMLVRENSDGTMHSFIGPSGQPNASETILNYADTNGFRVFLGLDRLRMLVRIATSLIKP